MLQQDYASLEPADLGITGKTIAYKRQYPTS